MNNNSVTYRESMAICKECGREFTAKIYNVLGHEITQSYCRECSDKLVAIEKQKEESARQIEIAAQRRRWRENCGIDLRYMSKDFSTFKTDKPGNIAGIYQKCLEYAGNFPIDYDNRTAKDKTYPSLLLFSLTGEMVKHILSQPLLIKFWIVGMVRISLIQSILSLSPKFMRGFNKLIPTRTRNGKTNNLSRKSLTDFLGSGC